MIGRKVALKVIHGDASQQDPQLRTFSRRNRRDGRVAISRNRSVFRCVSEKWQGRMYYVMEIDQQHRTAIGSAIAAPELVVYVGVLVARSLSAVLRPLEWFL